MKGKAKPKAKQNAKSNAKPKMNLPQGWFLMSKKEVKVQDLEVAAGNGYEVHIWTELQVAEIELGEKESIDIELIDTEFGDEYSDQFIASKEVKTIFYVSFRPECFEKAKGILAKIAKNLDAFVCGDTEDFTPFL